MEKNRQLDQKKFLKREDTMRIFLSMKVFDLEGNYSSQNDSIWTVSRKIANWTDGNKQ